MPDESRSRRPGQTGRVTSRQNTPPQRILRMRALVRAGGYPDRDTLLTVAHRLIRAHRAG
ncbi:MAG: hypothetical protein ACFE0O_07685 [Opitutales bacterium]